MVTVIKKMKYEDLDFIIEIENNAFSNPWTLTMFREEINKQQSYVIKSTKTDLVIGYICGRKILDEYHITNLAVSQEFQRRGLGTRLVKYIIGKMKLRNCREFYLEVRKNNLRALRMYLKIGFMIVGVRKEYYSEPVDDAIIMKYEIEN